ncbi:MAG: hypothetical protein JWP89_6920 [Schlesneria sp.]|nr:hypothetical protein [Schlesneria sp.]
MDHNVRAFARNMFRLLVHRSDGQAYEDLFVAVMRLSDPEFESVRPYGNVGDRKNDGFNAKAGTYFQVYAPQEYVGSEKAALEKLETDLAGLVAFWNPIFPVKEFCFVLNDKYRSIGPPLRALMEQLKAKYGLSKASIFLAQHLEQATFKLKDDEIISIVGHVPDIDAGEFLFLSGFTYFMGAWMDFERTARRIVSRPGDRPFAGRWLIDRLMSEGLLDGETQLLIYRLNQIRNPLVHGDSEELPEKAEIDKLVAYTEALKAKEIAS